MNKMVKGSIAGAAGVALLMGSFGTYAVWTDEAKLDAGKITTGELKIHAGTAVWADRLDGEAISLETFRIVPGDVIEMRQPLTVTAIGKNIAGKVSISNAGELSNSFANHLTHQVALEGAICTNDVCDFAAEQPESVTAVITVTFDDGIAGVLAQDASSALRDMTVTVEQVAPSANAG